MKFSILPTLIILLVTTPLAAQLYIQDNGSLTLSDEGSFLYTNGLSIEPGGTLTVRGKIEWVNQATNQGTLVFQIGDEPATGNFGKMVAIEGDDIEFMADAIRTELVDGFDPQEGALSYELITAGSLDQLPTTQELPGPLWSYRFTNAEVFAEFDAALPVEWLGFTGRWAGTSVELDWQTAVEVDADRFVVERQNTDGDWSSIGNVAAVGTSDTPNSYDFLDTEPGPTNPVLYRLQQVDYDGDFTYSDIVSLPRGAIETTISLFPNPARDHIMVEGMGGGSFTITDAIGREVARGNLNDARRFRIELPAGLPVGTYFLHPKVGNAQRFTVAQ